MARLLAFVFLFALAAPALAQEHYTGDHDAPRDYVRVPFNVSIWKGISLGDAIADGRPVLHHVSVNLPAGRAARLEGVALGVFSTVYEEEAHGIQVAGLANVVGDEGGGVQLAGLANVVGEEMHGIQAAGLANVIGERGGYVQTAGLANVAGEGFLGVQASGLANIAGEELQGLQLGGLANIAGEAASGAQLSSLANIAGESMTGLQVGGLANIAGEHLRGLQSGLFNIVGESVHGLQVGLANVAGERGGLQVGLVNVAGEEGGVPVGLYSRVARVPTWLTVGTDETAALHVGIRSGSRTIANYAGLSARPFSGASFRWGVFVGLGLEQPVNRQTAWSIDGTVHGLLEEDFGGWGGMLIRLRAVITRDLSDRLALYGGPAFSLFLSDDRDGGDLAPFSVWDDGPDPFVRAWPGVEAGVRVRLGT